MEILTQFGNTALILISIVISSITLYRALNKGIEKNRDRIEHNRERIEHIEHYITKQEGIKEGIKYALQKDNK